MKHIQRLSSLLLALVILVGLLPATVFALSDPALPTVDPKEVVIDYGKAVTFSIKDLDKHIHLNGGAVLGEFRGVTAEGSNGMLLNDAPTAMGCTTISGTGSTCNTLNGTVQRTTDTLSFTPSQFLSGIEYFYAVFSFNKEGNSFAYSYILVEIRIIPATMMYYEAEDFNSAITTINTSDGGKTSSPWGVANDQSGTGTTTQTYEQVGSTNYEALVIDKKNIPTAAFFADFDGTGNASRYSKHALTYGGNDFDTDECWYTTNSDADTYNTKAGVVRIAAKTDSSYQYMLTTVSGGSTTSSPIRIRPTINDFCEVRFKVTGVTAVSSPLLRLLFATAENTGVSTTAANIKDTSLTGMTDALLNEHYITVKVHLGDFAYYKNAETIYAFRFQLNGLTFSSGGEVVVDYIYLGSPQGSSLPKMGSEKMDYLYFGFDTSWKDTRYYYTSYQSINFSVVDNWSLDTFSAKPDSKNLSLSTGSPGYLKFSDNRTWDGENGMYYNAVQTGSDWATDTMKYTPKKTDVFIIRFKVTGDNAKTISTGNYGNKPVIGLEGKYYNTTEGDGGSTKYFGYVEYDLAAAKKGYIQKTLDLSKDTDWTTMASNSKKLGSIRPTFSNVDGATFYIDYIYIGPSSYMPADSKATDAYDPRDSAADKYFFSDFKPSDTERFRFANPLYNNQNFNAEARWGTRGTNFYSEAITGGAMVLTDQMTEAQENAYSDTSMRSYIHNLYITAGNLKIAGAKNHYFQMRLKIDNATKDSDKTPSIRLDYVVSGISGTQHSPTIYYEDLSKINNKGYFLVTIKLSNDVWKEGNTITSIQPVFGGTQGATITIDYVYVGISYYGSSSINFDPTVEANPAADSLYFGFDNSSENQIRYGTYGIDSAYAYSDTYGTKNFDTASEGYWSTNTSTNANTTSFSINNTKGILSLTATDTYYGGTYGPFLSTTATYGNYGMTAGQSILKYHPEKAEIFRIRFRIKDCSIPDGKVPYLTFLFGGYDEYGNYVNYNTDSYFYNEAEFFDTEDFQTLTIPLPQYFRDISLITILGLRFRQVMNGTIEIDYIYVGPGTVNKPNVTYGYDNSYDNDPMFSNGKSLKVEGKGVRIDPYQEELDNNTYTYPDAYTESTFSFTGTGFDIISRTGPNQSSIRLGVYNSPVMTHDSLVKSMTVNNYGDMDLYQIPVVSIQGLPHGKYYVKIAVNKGASIPLLGIYRGSEFHLDAIRVYDTVYTKGTTLTAEQKIARNAYRYHEESYHYIKEIRDTLLSVNNFNQLTLTDSTAGALFVDGKILTYTPPGEEPYDPVENHVAVTVKDYSKVGPKNEVYLSPGEAVSFKLVLDANKPFSIDIGAKTILNDSPATLAAGFVSPVNTSTGALQALPKIKENVNTATLQYYPLDATTIPTGTVYLVIYNAYSGKDPARNVLSITDLKVCYKVKPTVANLPDDDDYTTAMVDPEFTAKPAGRNGTVAEAEYDPFTFEVDGMVPDAVATFIGGLYETPIEEEPEEVITDDTLKIYHSLNLASDISVNFMVPAAALDGYDSFSMEVVLNDYEGDGLLGQSFRRPEAQRNGDYYYFTLSDLNATRMNDEIEANLYLTKDGKEYVSLTDTYSIAEYAYGQLEKANASRSLKTLCADLLVYGAKAQLYKGYRTDALADSALTDEQRAYCNDLSAVVFGNNNIVLEDLENPTVLWKGKSLSLDSRVGIRYIIDTASYEGDPSALSLRLTYVDQTGTEQAVTLTDPELYREGTAWYAFDFYGLLASELRTVIGARVYAGDTPLSQTLCYSADTYGNNKTGALADLCRALFAYSDSAKAFFAN